MLNLKEKVLVSFPSILISFLPLFLISGPFLSDLSVVLVCIFFILNLKINNNFDFLNNTFFKIFLIFFFYIVINSFFKFYDFNNIRSSVSYLRFGIFTLAVVYFLDKRPIILEWLFKVFIFCFLILIIDGYIQYFFKINIFGKEVDLGSRRIMFFLNDEYILGSFLSRLYPVFLGITFYLYKDNKKFIILLSIIFVLVETLIFLSGERVAFFFNTLSALFIILMIKNFKKIRLITLLLSFIAIIFISYFDNSAKNRIWDETIDQIGINSSKLNIFSETHEAHYNSAYRMFLDNKVFGIGIRNFRNFCSDPKYKIDDTSCSTHPHNTYIQLLSETGIIGLSFGLILFFYFVFKMLIHLRGALFNGKYFFKDYEICLLSAILITIWPISPSGNFFNNWLSIIYYFPLGFFIMESKK